MDQAVPLPHPWRFLRDELPHVDVIWANMSDDIWSLTDGIATIWLNSTLHQPERRCSLAHEIEHYRRGHLGCQPPAVERHVRAMAAQWLLPDVIPVMDVILAYDGITSDAAGDLWVDVPTLKARFDLRHTPPRQLHYAINRWKAHHALDDDTDQDPVNVDAG